MEQTCEEIQLGIFEKYLALWVFLCMVIGLLLSQFVPELSLGINNLQFAGISIPIGACLFLMMYPALLNLQFSELKKNGEKSEADYLDAGVELDLGSVGNSFSGVLFSGRS